MTNNKSNRDALEILSMIFLLKSLLAISVSIYFWFTKDNPISDTTSIQFEMWLGVNVILQYIKNNFKQNE